MRGDRGVTLLFVLVILALCSAVVVAMVTVSEGSITRSRLYNEATAAGALVTAGEVTAQIALRRDLATSADLDHGGEAWAAYNQADVAIAEGRFSLTIADAQGRFNLSNLATEGVVAQTRLADIVKALDLTPDSAGRIITAMQGSPARMDQLRDAAGLSAEDLAKLATMVTLLPSSSSVNVNSAPVALLAVLLKNPLQASLLVARRSKLGFVTREDVSGLGIVMPAGLGFTSGFFDLTVTAQVGQTVVTETAVIARGIDPNGLAEALVVVRQFGTGGAERVPSND